MDLTTVLMTPEVAAIAAGIVALLYGVGLIPTRYGRLARKRVWRRILPILPLALGVMFAFMPGVLPLEGSLSDHWGNHIIVGLWAGLVAAQGRKVIKRIAVDKLVSKCQ